MNKKDKYCNPAGQNIQLQKENQQLKIDNNKLRHEIKLLNEKLKRSESLVQFSENASEIAHEINNPINLVFGSMTILNNNVQSIIHLIKLYRQLTYPKNQSGYMDIQTYEDEIDIELTVKELSKCLVRIQKAVGRINEVADNLSILGKSMDTTRLKVDVNESIKNTLVMAETAFNENLQLFTEFGNIPVISSYRGKLNQVFTNLIENAIEAIQEKPELKNDFIFVKTSLNHNKVIIEIKDSGPGMSVKTKEKLYEKFYTTKSTEKGTGLGMGICKRIIEEHKGDIEVESEQGKGTTFTVSLPIKH